MELKEAIERVEKLKYVFTSNIDDRDAIDTVLEELNNRIPKEKIEKEFDYFTSHNNNFNIADMELLKDKILDEI